MNRWLLLIMIALLPMRGWVGDVMAAEMVTQRMAVVAQLQVQHPADASTEAHADCHGKAAVHSPASQPPIDTNTATLDCGNCTSCQVCHSVAIAPTALADPVAPAHSAAQPLRGTHFASAEPARGFKPPIY